MKIGIIGGGIAGLATAWLLRDDHAVTVYEKAGSLGGHARSIAVERGGRTVHVDIGFRYVFPETCPHVVALLRLLDVPVRRELGSFAFENAARDLRVALPPRTLRRAAETMRSGRILSHVTHFLRFFGSRRGYGSAMDDLAAMDRHAAAFGLPADFCRDFLYPFLAACWGMTRPDVSLVSAYSFLKVIRPDSRFLTIEGGSSRYIGRLASTLGGVELRTGTGVAGLRRSGAKIEIIDDRGGARAFDRVVLATPSGAAAAIARTLAGAEELAEVLGRFRQYDDHVVVHGDERLMPSDRGDWSVANVRCDGETSLLTEWSGRDERAPVFRTLCARVPVVARDVVHREAFLHPIVSPEHFALQRVLAGLQGQGGVWVTGIYTRDVDNHESALTSAFPVARALAPRSRNLARLERERWGLPAGPLPEPARLSYS